MLSSKFANSTEYDYLKYFEWSESDTEVFLPNEIFNNLNDVKVFEDFNVNFRHKAFAYTYYYLINYLYRNCKYSSLEPLSKINSIKLIELLQCSRTRYNYIIKKDGLLDYIGYTKSQNDFPIDYQLELGELVDFRLFSELESHVKKTINVPPHFICKFPIKAFKRERDSINFDGTFFEFYSTHRLDFKAFTRCMSFGKNGIEIFYIYGFLKAFCYYITLKPNVNRAYVYKTLKTNNKKLQYCLEKLKQLQLVEVVEGDNFSYRILDIE